MKLINVHTIDVASGEFKDLRLFTNCYKWEPTTQSPYHFLLLRFNVAALQVFFEIHFPQYFESVPSHKSESNRVRFQDLHSMYQLAWAYPVAIRKMF